MPNRRRRKLSTAMSAVAALAVASPFAAVAVTELSASTEPAPQQRDFVQASLITDLPNELLSVFAALGRGLLKQVRHQRAADADGPDRFGCIDTCDVGHAWPDHDTNYHNTGCRHHTWSDRHHAWPDRHAGCSYRAVQHGAARSHPPAAPT